MRVLVLAAALVALCAAVPAREFLERSTSVPLAAGWSATARQSDELATKTRDVIMVLKQRVTLDVLESMLYDRADPKSPRYTQWLSQDEVTELVAPTPEALRAVFGFLRRNGVAPSQWRLNAHRDMLRLTVTLEQAAALFDVAFHEFVHTETQTTFPTTLGPYSLPAPVARHVSYVSGLVGTPELGRPTMRVSKQGNPAPITPDVIRARYNMTTISKTQINSLGVAEFQAQYFSKDDLAAFFKRFVSFAPPTVVSQLIGTNMPGRPSIEGSLDIQYASGSAGNVSRVWYYSMKKFDFFSDLTTWQAELTDEATPTVIQSVSYGSQGNYPSTTYISRADSTYATIGLRGISIIFASGDSGAGCGGSSNGGRCGLAASYPAISPYVTSVGATRFLRGSSGPEGAVQLFLSGGGFSEFHPVPTYQQAALAAYLQSGVPFPASNAFNSSNRLTPDVGALGDEAFQVLVGGSITAVGGTSASAPTFAAVIALLNDQRYAAGKQPLGFLNPWIYQTWAATKARGNGQSAFWDVTVGDNVCQQGGGSPCGYKCAVGLDAVTGVGTPNFPVLSQFV